MSSTLLEKFLSYVQVDTQSVPDVECYPSSAKQLTLLKALSCELQQMGISAEMDEQ